MCVSVSISQFAVSLDRDLNSRSFRVCLAWQESVLRLGAVGESIREGSAKTTKSEDSLVTLEKNNALQTVISI